MKAIQSPTIISSIRSKVDRSLSLTIHTPELSVDERSLFMELQGMNCNTLFQPIDEPNAPLEKINKDIETKTASQRLRGVLYVLWEQRGSQGDFSDFYRDHMEKVIDYLKTKLD